MTTELWKVTVEARLLKLLSELGELPNDPARIETAFAGRGLILQLMPIHERIGKQREPRTECEKDCVALLRETGKAMTRSEIRTTLKKNYGKDWGTSTIAVALADLVTDGVLLNSRKRGGYYLPD